MTRFFLSKDLRKSMESCTQVAHVRLAPGLNPGPTSGVRVSMSYPEGRGNNESKCSVCWLVE